MRRHLWSAAVPVVLCCFLFQSCHKRVATNRPFTQPQVVPKQSTPPPQQVPEPQVGKRPEAEVRPKPPTLQPVPPVLAKGEVAAAPGPPAPRHQAKHAHRRAPAAQGRAIPAATAPTPVTDSSRPRKIFLSPDAPQNSAAYKFDAPTLQQGQMARFRLLVDPSPIRSQTPVPGTTNGSPFPLSSPLDAQLSSGQSGLTIVAEDAAQRTIDPARSEEWFWDITPTGTGKASLRLDLNKIVNGEKIPIEGFPIHNDIAVTPSQPVPPQPAAPNNEANFPFWWLAIATLVAGIVWLIVRRRKKPEPAPGMAAATSQRTILRKEDSYVFVIDVLTIYYATDQARLPSFCKQIADDRYRFNVGIAGFAAGSPRWQQWFTDSLATCDAVLVALTTDSLGEKWLNWQLDKARAAQTEREIPLYVAALDDQVLKVARTIQLLEGTTVYPPTPEGQEELKASLRSSELASTRNIRCFISYSHAHRDFANRICGDLNHAGIRTWMDVEGIPGGSAWKQAIANAIDASTHVLFVLTAESVKSDQVANEIDWAQQKKKVIIPIMENEVDLPFGLLGTQYISFMQGYDAGFRRLLQDLAAGAAAKRAAGA